MAILTQAWVVKISSCQFYLMDEAFFISVIFSAFCSVVAAYCLYNITDPDKIMVSATITGVVSTNVRWHCFNLSGNIKNI